MEICSIKKKSRQQIQDINLVVSDGESFKLQYGYALFTYCRHTLRSRCLSTATQHRLIDVLVDFCGRCET